MVTKEKRRMDRRSDSLLSGLHKFASNLVSNLTFPAYVLYWITSEKKVIREDVNRWSKVNDVRGSFYSRMTFLFFYNNSLRKLFYYRLSKGNFVGAVFGRLLSFIYKGVSLLFIECEDIGGGLIIQHGFSTIIAAKRIGHDCWINQQVTVGARKNYVQSPFDDLPTIGNNVSIGAGAKVLGKINVGNSVRIGANAVVTKDVPDNSTVVEFNRILKRSSGSK